MRFGIMADCLLDLVGVAVGAQPAERTIWDMPSEASFPEDTPLYIESGKPGGFCVRWEGTARSLDYRLVHCRR